VASRSPLATATAAAARGAFSAAISLLAALALGCASSPPAEWASLREVTPAFLLEQDALHPALAADEHGRVALTWVTRDSSGTDLWLSTSTDSGSTFTPPVQVSERQGSVVSFPENRPLAAFGTDGRLAIAWCEQREGDPEATDVLVRSSEDGGATLGPAVVVNDDAGDKRAGFHGFPALAFLPDGALLAVWMDERDNWRIRGSKGEPSSGLLFCAISRDGGRTWSDNRKLTDRACPCCRAAAASDSSGRVAVAYRAAGGDLRDPALAISNDHGRSFDLDSLFSADGWRLAGCPAVGPALTWNRSDGGLYVWYTEGGGPGVYAAPWTPENGRAGDADRGRSAAARRLGEPRARVAPARWRRLAHALGVSRRQRRERLDRRPLAAPRARLLERAPRPRPPHARGAGRAEAAGAGVGVRARLPRSLRAC